MGESLPYVNIFQGETLATFWNFVGSAFYLGMPVLLITVVLLLLPLVFDMIINAVKKANEDEQYTDYSDY